MSMDISDTILADSTQVNAADLAGPVIVTVAGVTRGNEDQPVNIQLAEFPGKAFRPCKTVRRLLVAAWGKDASQYVGRKMTIFNDPSVRWGGHQVGGVRVSALSHIDKPLTLPLPVSRGKSSTFTVQPLPDTTPAQPQPVVTEETVRACQSVDDLRAMWGQASPDMQTLIRARVDELNTTPADPARDPQSPYEGAGS